MVILKALVEVGLAFVNFSVFERPFDFLVDHPLGLKAIECLKIWLTHS